MYIRPDIIQEIQSLSSLEQVVRATGYHTVGNGSSKGISQCPRCGRDHTHIKINCRKHLFHCMSPTCGWSGNVFHWIMEVEKCSFPSAVERVANIIHYIIPGTTQEEKDLRDKQSKCLEDTILFYAQFDHEYIQKRGITRDNAKKYRIGYAPGGQQLKDYLNQLGYDDEFLLEMKLIRKVRNQLMDSFFHRVIIPIVLDHRIVDIYGRSIHDDGVKHFYLYGQRIMMGYDDLISGSPALLVEGPFDYLSLCQHQIKNIFFIGGAGKFSSFHINRLKKKNISEVYIGYDTGDQSLAGQEGAIETGQQLQDHKIHARIIQMPSGVDVNQFLHDHPIEEYKKRIQQAMSFDQYHAFWLLSKIPMHYIEDYLHNPNLIKGLSI